MTSLLDRKIPTQCPSCKTWLDHKPGFLGDIGSCMYCGAPFACVGIVGSDPDMHQVVRQCTEGDIAELSDVQRKALELINKAVKITGGATACDDEDIFKMAMELNNKGGIA